MEVRSKLVCAKSNTDEDSNSKIGEVLLDVDRLPATYNMHAALLLTLTCAWTQAAPRQGCLGQSTQSSVEAVIDCGDDVAESANGEGLLAQAEHGQ